MKFGSIDIDHAHGAILAHTTMAGDVRLRKGTIIGSSQMIALISAGIETVTVAQLDGNDLNEDDAAQRIALSMSKRIHNIEAKSAHTGRVNLHATQSGLLTLNEDIIHQVNAIDPAITLATLNPMTRVTQGKMVATIKIIPFAVSVELVEEACKCFNVDDIMQVHPYKSARVGLVQTVLPMIKQSVLDKTIEVTKHRLARSHSQIVDLCQVHHSVKALKDLLGTIIENCDIVIIFGASAMCDGDDVIPFTIRELGGQVERVGMPVDPGNLLLLGYLRGKPVIGAPGCARSSKENGFDWVLDRILTGLEVNNLTIAKMGVGGLLGEISTRPQPREG